MAVAGQQFYKWRADGFARDFDGRGRAIADLRRYVVNGDLRLPAIDGADD